VCTPSTKSNRQQSLILSGLAPLLHFHPQDGTLSFITIGFPTWDPPFDASAQDKQSLWSPSLMPLLGESGVSRAESQRSEAQGA